MVSGHREPVWAHFASFVARGGWSRRPLVVHVDRLRGVNPCGVGGIAVVPVTHQKHDIDQMRRVCLKVCPSLPGCQRDVAVDLQAGRVVAGFRAGVSVRARSRRLA